MKIKFLILCLLFSICATAQKVDEKLILKPVLSKFYSLYPDIKPGWYKDNEGNYIAKFKKDKTTVSVMFSYSGDLSYIETLIKPSELPKAVLDYMASNYPRQKIKGAAKLDDGNRNTGYQVSLKSTSFFFDGKGNFVNMVEF